MSLICPLKISLPLFFQGQNQSSRLGIPNFVLLSPSLIDALVHLSSGNYTRVFIISPGICWFSWPLSTLTHRQSIDSEGAFIMHILPGLLNSGSRASCLLYQICGALKAREIVIKKGPLLSCSHKNRK